MGLLEIPISSTNFTLWKVTFSVWKTYERNKFSYDDAYENFESICDGVVPDQFEEDFDEDEDWYFSADFSYYACDSGHGSNIVNDCIASMNDDGINESNFDEWEYRWNQQSIEGNEDWIPSALASFNENIKFENGKLIGSKEDLSEFIDE